MMTPAPEDHDDDSPCERWSSDLHEQVAHYAGVYPDEHERLAPLLAALAAGEELHSRSNPRAHLSASGIVLACDRVLLIHHPYLQRWLQPGGHLEPGEHPEQAAQRETVEETGASVRLHAWHVRHRCPLDIDVHEIPANPARGEGAHLHFDFRYLMYCMGLRRGDMQQRLRYATAADCEHAGLGELVRKLRALRPYGVELA